MVETRLNDEAGLNSESAVGRYRSWDSRPAALARRLSLKVGIASNSHHAWVDTHLARLELSSFFDVVKCRDDVARGKPDPELYQAVLDHFRITGIQAIAFEDSEAGSLAAKSAGLWCIAIPNPSTLHHAFGHVDLRLNSLAESSVEALLARFGSGR